MIDLVNSQYMTRAERRESLKRALNSQCFFNLIEFALIAAANNSFQYGAKGEVDKDFYITESKGNWSLVFNDAGNVLFSLSLYVANQGKSLYNVSAGENLPTPFQCTNAQTDIALTPDVFDDRQRELMPRLVKRGHNIIARAQNLAPKLAPVDIQIVLSGYYTQPITYIAPRIQQGIDESLKNNEPRFELWKFDVDFTGIKTRILNNDRYARMVLGFGIVLKDDREESTIPTGTMQITDVYRGIKLNNVPINIGFFAPKINQVKDQHIYYLPIEHFWEPFSPIKFDVVNALNDGAGYEFQMLTRTV